MLENLISIRADHPKSGKVIPISLTTDSGDVWRIDSVFEIQDCNGEVKYSCRIKNRIITLTKRGDAWSMDSNDEIV